MESKLALNSKLTLGSRRRFLGRGFAAGSALALAGHANILSAFTPGEASAGQAQSGAASGDINILCSTDAGAAASQSLQIVNLVHDGPQAVWIGSMGVFNNEGEIVMVGGQYQDRLGVERNTLRFQPNMAPARITMSPGQMQLWHIVNESPGVNVDFQPFAAGSGFQWSRTAGDDVPLVWENYSRASNQNAAFTLGPANRADLLVRAPSAPGVYGLNVSARIGREPGSRFAAQRGGGSLVNIEVSTSHPAPSGKAAALQEFPASAALYPATPDALHDIVAVSAQRSVTFSDASFGARAGSDTPLMSLSATEEWRVSNTTALPRTLHFASAPVQILEIFDPATMDSPQDLAQPWPWADTLQIPAAHSVPGSVTLRLAGTRRQGPYVWRGALFSSL